MQSVGDGKILAGDEHDGSAVGEGRGGAGGNHAIGPESRAQGGQRLGRGLRADTAICIDPFAGVGLDRDDFVGKPAFGAGGSGLAVRLYGQGLLIATGYLPAQGNVFGGFSHADIGIAVLEQARMRGKVEAALRHHGHGFDTNAEEGIAHAGFDLGSGDMNSLHGGTAETIDGHPPDLLRQPGEQADDATKVIPLGRLGVSATQNDIFQQGGIKVGARQQPLDDLSGKVIRAGGGECAFTGEMEGGTGVGGNEGFHDGLRSTRARDSAGLLSFTMKVTIDKLLSPCK